MRKDCTSCARKHLAQAEVLMAEALKGYPLHAWLAAGHMAEAEDELLENDPEMANQIRDHRVRYIAFHEGVDDQPHEVPTLDLIEALCDTDAHNTTIELPEDDDGSEDIRDLPPAEGGET